MCFNICTKYEHTFDSVIIAVIIMGSIKLAFVTFIDEE